MLSAMHGYYAERLSADRLRRCYELASPRVRRYLAAEIEHVAARLTPRDRVLEIGCGYGRVAEHLAACAGAVIGIDTSWASLEMARRGRIAGLRLALMDAGRLALAPCSFDVTACVQNGIAVFQVDPRRLVGEALRVTRPGGRVFFSSYAEGFWPERLEWFRAQAAHGLLGEIDEERTGDGAIICRDGFRSATVTRDEFAALAAEHRVAARIEEVDGSSLICEMTVGREGPWRA
jgi:2-polyprenyl-6-hydroxyphenyl methylase/3-demethylubiquinone-9 3-methyltransferase